MRVWIGVGIAVHGWSAVGDAKAMEGFAGFLTKLEIPAPVIAAWSAKLSEFLGGILLAVGLLTRPAALFLTVTLGVAVFVAHGGDPLFASPGQRSKEMAVLYLVPFIAFFIMGPGPFALDRFLQGGADPKD